MTADWYRAVLLRLPKGTHTLDVGIGTGLALVRNLDLIESKFLRFTGIDYDNDYMLRCSDLFKSKGLSSKGNEVHYASVYDWKGGPYDAAYFSGSLMIMPDRPGALRHVMSLLKPGGKIYVTQTLEEEPNKIMELIKPFLKFALTIDFGSVTYEKDFLKTVEDAGLRLCEREILKKTPARSFNLFVLEK
jgi:ubiquinone/menaquinone biosynthesis C-methylase UbiE